MKRIKVGLFGASGKMGQAIQDSLNEARNKIHWQNFLAVAKDQIKGFDLSVPDLESIENEILAEVDVWVDFSSDKGLQSLIKKTERYKTPIVTGTTGLSSKDFSDLKKQSKKRPIFWASNMSPGLWAFRQALKSFQYISNFDFAVDEIHHNQKKDKPSGTALTLHKDLEKILEKTIPLPEAHRLGSVFGIHNVYAVSNSEIIHFQHQALSRKVFSQGALDAARWLINKKSGLYSMDDLFLSKKK